MNAVYILTNRPHGTLYVGVTSNLVKRIYEHKNNFVDSFSKKYNLRILVYFEQTADIYEAIVRETRLKIALIDKFNPNWKDLYTEIIG